MTTKQNDGDDDDPRNNNLLIFTTQKVQHKNTPPLTAQSTNRSVTTTQPQAQLNKQTVTNLSVHDFNQNSSVDLAK